MSDSLTVSMLKKMLRKKMGEKIARSLKKQPGKTNELSREMESEIVREKLLANEWFRNARRLSIYVSTELEISTDEIIRKALEGGKEVFIPRFRKGSQQLEMLRLGSEAEFDSLDNALWGIRQHAAHLNPPSFDSSSDKESLLDLVIVPGLAFTTGGKRLGHGRGFYDRFLNEYALKYGTYPRTIALALKIQLEDDLPMEAHDRIIDLVLHA